MACWPRPSRPTMPEATSPSISIPKRASRTASRSRADDVLFSWALLRDQGRPNHRQYYSKVAKAEAPDPLTVRFDFGGANDRELPLILGPDADLAAARHRSRDLRGNHDDGTDRFRPLPRHCRQARRQRDVRRAIPTIGAAICRSTAVCGISTRSGSISIARPTASSRRSSAASMTFASRPSRCAGTTATIFRPPATAR